MLDSILTLEDIQSKSIQASLSKRERNNNKLKTKKRRKIYYKKMDVGCLMFICLFFVFCLLIFYFCLLVCSSLFKKRKNKQTQNNVRFLAIFFFFFGILELCWELFQYMQLFTLKTTTTFRQIQQTMRNSFGALLKH